MRNTRNLFQQILKIIQPGNEVVLTDGIKEKRLYHSPFPRDHEIQAKIDNDFRTIYFEQIR